MPIDWGRARAMIAGAVTQNLGEDVTFTPRVPSAAAPTGSRTYTSGTPVTVKAKRGPVEATPAGGTSTRRSTVAEVEYVVSLADLGFTPDVHTLVTDNGVERSVCKPPEIIVGGSMARVTCRDVGSPR